MTVIQPRRGTAAQWADANPVLAEGELGYETDTRKAKRGVSGVHWNDLSYTGGGSTEGMGVSLYDLGLTNSTLDIGALINSAGVKHIIVPYQETPWPSLTTITRTGVWLEFEAGARISFDHDETGISLTNSRLTNASFTSVYTGPETTGDATSARYAYPARRTTLGDDCLVDGSYYHENATAGIWGEGANITYNCALRFRNLRHQRGWANALHHNGALAHNIHVNGPVIVEDCDRGIENEDGCYDITFAAGGHFKSVYPNGYAGQGSATTYETYSFLLDAHGHAGTGGPRSIVFNGTWVIENCAGAVHFASGSATEPEDMPSGCYVQEVRIIGRGLSTGHADIRLQGRDHRVGRAVFSEGAGIAGGVFKIRGETVSANNVVESVTSESAAAVPAVTDFGTGLRVGAIDPWPLPAASRSGLFIPLGNRRVGTHNNLGVGTLRTTPVYIPTRITIDQLGAETTVAGDAGSVLRVGIYTDASGLPGEPLVDVTVPTDEVAIAMADLSADLTLEPGWYHVGGAVQEVSSMQPTIRIIIDAPPEDRFLIFNQNPSAGTPVGYSKSNTVTGALPSYGTTIQTSNTAPRIWARVAS